MILTDIYVPALDSTFDFQLDENVPVRMLIDEITEVLSKKTAGNAEGIGKGFVLCSADQGMILDGGKTLQECNICNGSRLFLV